MDVEFIKKELQYYLGIANIGSCGEDPVLVKYCDEQEIEGYDRFLEANNIGERSYVRLEDGITLGIENIPDYKGDSKIASVAVIRDSYCIQCGVTATEGDAEFCIACAV
jgi:hypothetical protein